MINGWDVNAGVDVTMSGKFKLVCFRAPIKKDFEKAAILMSYDCTGDEFYLMGMRGEIDWSRLPEYNYFSEDFNDILSDAIRGNDNNKVTAIENRKRAIMKGAELIKDNDCLVILGKGHEETQEIKNSIIYFSDYEVVNEIYK